MRLVTENMQVPGEEIWPTRQKAFKNEFDVYRRLRLKGGISPQYWISSKVLPALLSHLSCFTQAFHCPQIRKAICQSQTGRFSLSELVQLPMLVPFKLANQHYQRWSPYANVRPTPEDILVSNLGITPSISGIRNHCDDKRAKDNEFAQLRARVNRKHIVPAGPEMILIISRRANRSPIASEGWQSNTLSNTLSNTVSNLMKCHKRDMCDFYLSWSVVANLGWVRRASRWPSRSWW
jgi:hypothetical protein